MSSVSPSGKSSERHFNGTTQKARYLCLAIEGTQWKKKMYKKLVEWLVITEQKVAWQVTLQILMVG